METEEDSIRIDAQDRIPIGEMTEPVIDFDEGDQVWLGICPHCGVIRRAPADVLGHDQVVWAVVKHWAVEHGGDGLISWDMLISLSGGDRSREA